MLLATGLLIGASYSGLGDHTKLVIGDVGPVALGLVAVATAWRASVRPDVDPRVRRAWRRLTVAFGCWWLGDLAWCVLEVLLHRSPFPSLADAGYLAFYPCGAWALLSFPSVARRRRDWTTFGLDALTVLLCAAMGIWYLVIGPVVHSSQSSRGLAQVLTFAYPVGDLVLLFGVTVTLLRRTGGSLLALRLLVGGIGALVVADVAYAHLDLAGTYNGGLPDAFWLAAWCLFFLAAHTESRSGGSAAPGRGPSERPPARLPYLAVALAYVLLLVVGRRAAVYPLDGLILGAAAVTAVVLVRQVGTIAENVRLMSRLQTLANVDALTGIPNRRAFFEEAEPLFGTSGRVRRHAVLMVDVDDFKDVNDTFGHRAGDRVLSVVAASVQSQLRSTDLVGRYGGDELVVALTDCGDGAFAVAERIRRIVAATPIVTDDGVVNVTLSIGVACSENGEGLLPLLARADLALYD